MGINTSDVYLIIHFNFPLSLGQYIQESDFKLLYGIISESRADAGEDETLQRRIYLGQGLQNLREIMFFCEEKYKCLQQILLNFYAWSADAASSSCGNCSNC